MIPYEDVKREIAYSFTNYLTGRSIHIASHRLATFCGAHCMDRLISIAVEQHTAEHYYVNGGLEPHRLNRIHGEIREPIVLIDIESPVEGDMKRRAQQLVDGAHRYVRAYEQGIKWLRGWIVPEAVWREFEIGDLPPEIEFADPAALIHHNRTGPSGIA